ncbi:hypothetical protein [uncultured Microbacterium sp.]|uniref:hypothetical protein n=1 Tax=uncultured Microbacterium sp. TaxID=191216 RepID=UPI00260F185F|nr:hypothetical protein [uncultured Microbacterium sp.]
MMSRRAWGLLTIGTISATLLLAGCSSPATTTTSVCIDWVYFESPADAEADADAVVVGTVESQSGATTYYDLPATTWNVNVDTWIKGGAASNDIVVTSLPKSCGETGDNMADAVGTGRVVLFLRDGDDGWETLTPFQGIVPAGSDGDLPTEWPDDLYD